MIRICECCGNEFEDASKFKPRFYCSKNCSNFVKFKSALEVSVIHLECTIDAKKVIRGDLFRLANILSKRTFTKQIRG